MGYFVSPSGGDVASTRSSTNSSLSLDGKYVDTGTHSVSRVTSATETLEIDTNIKDNNIKSSNFSNYSVFSTGANVVPEIKTVTPAHSSEMHLDGYYTSEAPGAIEKVGAYLGIVGLGFGDIIESLIDGIAVLFHNRSWAEVDRTGKLRDDLAKTGVDAGGAYKIGQVIGEIAICALVIGAIALLPGITIATVPLVAAAICCGVVGLVIGIGQAAERFEKGLQMVFSAVIEAFSLAAIGVGLAGTAAAIASATGNFLESFISKITNWKNIVSTTINDFKQGKLKFIIKCLFDLDIDKIRAKDVGAIINIFVKFGKDLLSFARDIIYSGKGLLNIGKDWALGKIPGFLDDLFGGSKVINIFVSSILSISQQTFSVSGVFSTFISKFTSILKFIYSPVSA